MCGICGFIGHKEISGEELRIMNDTMYHRGPDDAGVEIFTEKNGYHAGMAQRRLSILDLSALGHQPMHSPDSRITVVYNGEIYNYRELKKELTDYSFRSGADTEVIIAAYLEWGISCVERFNGMFAFALYDRETQELFLVRDRAGQKPLYYWIDADREIADPHEITGMQGLVYASELKPLMACPCFKAEIRTDILPRFLYQQYINAPETIFRNVFKLEPGMILRFHDGEIRLRKYWEPSSVYSQLVLDPVQDYETAKQELREKIRDAVRMRLIADVPLGAFLSGGYDSSLISAVAQEILGSRPLKTFSIGFKDERYDESGYARKVAEALGTDHTQMVIGEEDMLSLVESIPAYFDEPMADSSQIPTMLVSKLAREHVTVALSGDAGDEFFCGYNVYDMIAKAQQLDRLGGIAYRAGRALGIYDKLPLKVRIIAGNRDPETKSQFGMGSYAQTALGFMADSERLVPVNYPWESKYPSHNWQVRRMLLDMETYLPGDILAKVDRASMKYSLENRCPLLDKEVMEYSFRIPHEFKYKGGSKKAILKDIVYDYLPKDLMERPKKGFSVPLDTWLRGPLRDQLLALTDRDYLIRQGIFNAQAVQDFVMQYMKTGDAGPGTGRNYSGLCWSLFIFQQWYEHFRSEVFG